MMMIMPEKIRYRYASREDIDKILLKHVIQKKRITELLVLPKHKVENT